MQISPDQIEDLKHAYRVFDLPLSASPSSIKGAYRKLLKRWHPDLYPLGDPAQTEATQMTKLINEAYMAIKSAPLRYYIEACPPAYVKTRQAAYPPHDERTRVTRSLPKTDWLEFCVRFFCGSVLGALLSFRALLFNYDRPSSFIQGVVAITLVCGFGAALFGDNFWHTLLRRWWMWW